MQHEYGMIEPIHIRTIDSYLENFANRTVLEIGYGSTSFEAKTGWAKHYYAVEMEEAHLVQLKQPNVLVLKANAKRLPFADGTIDLILAFGLFGALDVYTDSKEYEQWQKTADHILKVTGTRPLENFEFGFKRRADQEQRNRLLENLRDEHKYERSKELVDEMHRALVTDGVVLISNSLERQLLFEFRGLLVAFSKVEVLQGPERYLLIAKK